MSARAIGRAVLLVGLLMALALAFSGNAGAVDRIEIKQAEAPAMCPVTGLPLPMPCAFVYAIVQKMMGGGCGERTCPVRL